MIKPLNCFSIIAGLTVWGWQLPGQASVPLSQPNSTPSPVAKVTFQPPANPQHAPATSHGEPSRQGPHCPQADRPVLGRSVPLTAPALTLLVPSTMAALTTAERPALFIYVPQSPGKQVLLNISDPQGHYYYQTPLPPPNSAGVIHFQVPAAAPPFVVGQRYQWSVVMACGDELLPDSPMVSGEIERVALDPSLAQALASQPPHKRATLFGQQGIWYDTLANLADARHQRPRELELTQAWQQILASVGLKDIATAPILDP